MDLRSISQNLNDYNFSVKIPSSGVSVMGRPYNIKEQFKMAQLNESKNKKVLLAGLKDILRDKYYTMTDDISKNLSMVDVKYLLLQLKIQSDEPTLKSVITCKHCEETFKHAIDLNAIKVDDNLQQKNIEVDNNNTKLTIVLKNVPYDVVVDKYIDNLEVENSSEMLIDSIDSISYGDEMVKTENISHEEIEYFIQNLPKKYYAQFNDFVENQPNLVYHIQPKCEHCGKLNTVNLDDFFYLFF